VEGYCDRQTRTIEIVVDHSDPDAADLLLIHEVCHAIATGSHGVVWQRRMERSARDAEVLGRTRLAELLRAEVAAYRNAGSATEDAYADIREAVRANPHLTLKQLKAWLGSEYCLLPCEVDGVFRRTGAVFREAKRDSLRRQARHSQSFAGGVQ
jgi:hypothetical protein